MIIITENIEDPIYHYKKWYKDLTTLIGTQLDATPILEHGLCVGQTICIDHENPTLPDGMTISEGSTISLNDLSAKTLEILSISQKGNLIIINLGVRSTASKDNIE